jgi:hypothetical protein
MHTARGDVLRRSIPALFFVPTAERENISHSLTYCGGLCHLTHHHLRSVQAPASCFTLTILDPEKKGMSDSEEEEENVLEAQCHSAAHNAFRCTSHSSPPQPAPREHATLCATISYSYPPHSPLQKVMRDSKQTGNSTQNSKELVAVRAKIEAHREVFRAQDDDCRKVATRPQPHRPCEACHGNTDPWHCRTGRDLEESQADRGPDGEAKSSQARANSQRSCCSTGLRCGSGGAGQA